jgi:hypothetical protein
MIEFIFMLTRDDVTVEHAIDVYDQVRATDLKYVGFKDIGAAAHDLAEITRRAHDDGREVMLEVVSTSAEDEIRSIEMAPQIGVDWVLGGTHAQAALRRLAGSGLRFCPFPGQVVGHPSVLRGEIADVAASAKSLTAIDGVYGLDLLAYRHQTADVEALTRAVVSAASGPVIAAGSVGSIDQIRALARSGAWGFTIGTAIFEGRFAGAPDIAQQVRDVMAAARLASPAAP